MVSRRQNRAGRVHARLKILSDMLRESTKKWFYYPESNYQTAIARRTGLAQGYVSQELARMLSGPSPMVKVVKSRPGPIGRGKVQLYDLTAHGLAYYLAHTKEYWN